MGSAEPISTQTGCAGVPQSLPHAQGAPAAPHPAAPRAHSLCPHPLSPCSAPSTFPVCRGGAGTQGSHAVPACSQPLAAQTEAQKELVECFLSLPIASLPAQPNWAEQGCLTGFYPARLVWLCPHCLLARQVYFLVLLAAAFMWDELLCSPELQPGSGELLCTHRSVLLPPGRAKTSSPVTATGNVPVPGHAVPCVVALESLSASLLAMAAQGMLIQRTAGLLRQPQILLHGQNLCPNARKEENWPHPRAERSVTPGGVQDMARHGTQCLLWVIRW